MRITVLELPYIVPLVLFGIFAVIHQIYPPSPLVRPVPTMLASFSSAIFFLVVVIDSIYTSLSFRNKRRLAFGVLIAISFYLIAGYSVAIGLFSFFHWQTCYLSGGFAPQDFPLQNCPLDPIETTMYSINSQYFWEVVTRWPYHLGRLVLLPHCLYCTV